MRRVGLVVRQGCDRRPGLSAVSPSVSGMSITAAGPPPTDPADPAAALELLRRGVEALAGAEPTRVQVEQLGGLLVGLQGLLDAAGGVAAQWTAVFDRSGGPEQAGAPTLAAWMRRELRLTGAEARRRVRAHDALTVLPAVRQVIVTLIERPTGDLSGMVL